MQTIFTIVSSFPSLLVLSMASTIIQQVVFKKRHNNYPIYPIYKFITSVYDGARRSSRSGPVWGVGEGEVCYKQTQPSTPGFRPTEPGVGVGEGKVCYKQTQPSTPGFRPTGPGMGGGGGRGLLQTDPARHSRILT
jgi:hypothetical protein